MTAPFRIPPLGTARKQSSADPFADLADVANPPADPFTDLQDIEHTALSRPHSSAEILARNEEGRRRDASESTIRGQIVAGARSALEGLKHPVATIKGMAAHAVDDLGTVASAMDAGLGQPSDLTEARAHEVPRAALNTAANVLLPLAPASGLAGRAAINATLGAVNDSDQPIRGATAGMLLGEALHQAPKVIPSRVLPPENRMASTSEGTRQQQFMARIEDTSGRPSTDALAGLMPNGVPKPTRPLAGSGEASPVESYSRPLVVPTKRAPAGLQQASDVFADLPDVVAKVKPVATEAVDAPLETSAATYQAGIERLAQQAALRERTGVRRRPGGLKADDLGTPLVEDTAPVAPLAPVPAEPAYTDSGPLPSYPEGFAMGGAEPRIPDFAPPRVRGSDPVTLPDGITAEAVELAKSVAPNRYRGHQIDALAEAALDVQKAIETAQGDIERARQRGLVGEAAQADMENRGTSYSDETEASSRTAERALSVAKTRMGQIEREFALRGFAGDDLADLMQGARERRMEQQGAGEESHLGMSMGEDPFADIPDVGTSAAGPSSSVESLGALPVGTPRPGSLFNHAGFAEELRPGLAAGEADLAGKGITKMRVSLDEQRAQAEPLRRSLAADLGVSVLDMDPQKTGRLTGAEIVALKEAAGASMDQITALSKQLADPSISTADRAGVSTLLDNARAARDGMLERVITATSQKGRDLAFLRQIAQRTLDPDVWMVNAKRALGDRPLTDETIASLNKLVREAADACGGGAT